MSNEFAEAMGNTTCNYNVNMTPEMYHYIINQYNYAKLDEERKIQPDPQSVAMYKRFSKLYYSVSKRIRGLSSEDCFRLFKEINT